MSERPYKLPIKIKQMSVICDYVLHHIIYKPSASLINFSCTRLISFSKLLLS